MEFVVTPDEGYEYETVECTNSQTATYNETNSTLMVSKVSNSSTCTLTFKSVDRLDVNFDRNGSTGTNTSLGCYCYNDTEICEITTPDIERDGFTTVGWSNNSNSHTADYNENTEINLNETLNGTTLYAITYKTFTINYLCSQTGCTSTITNPTSEATIWNNNTNVDAVLISNPFNRNGYTFTNWNTMSNGNGISYTTAMNIAYTVNPLINLYAMWNINTYNIEYELNGGTNNNENPIVYTVENNTITFKPATKTGYEFVGWYSDEELTIAKANILSGSTGNVKVYAKWDIVDYTITYELNGGTNSNENPNTYTINDTVTFKDATKTGYTFAGWYTTETFDENSKVRGITVGSTGNVKVYAKWDAIEYAISYELNGGTNHNENPTVYTVETGAITFKDATKTGYTFAGWYTTETFDKYSKVRGIAAGSTGNVKVYAKWDAIEYTITFNLNNEGFTATNPNTSTGTIKYTIASENINIVDAVADSRNFLGWYTNDVKVDSVLKGSYGDISLTASWGDIYTYKVSFIKILVKANGTTEKSRTLVQEETVNYGANYVNVPSQVTEENYVCSAWENIDLSNITTDTVVTATCRPNLLGLKLEKETINTSLEFRINESADIKDKVKVSKVYAGNEEVLITDESQYTINNFNTDTVGTRNITATNSGLTSNSLEYVVEGYSSNYDTLFEVRYMLNAYHKTSSRECKNGPCDSNTNTNSVGVTHNFLEIIEYYDQNISVSSVKVKYRGSNNWVTMEQTGYSNSELIRWNRKTSGGTYYHPVILAAPEITQLSGNANYTIDEDVMPTGKIIDEVRIDYVIGYSSSRYVIFKYNNGVTGEGSFVAQSGGKNN